MKKLSLLLLTLIAPLALAAHPFTGFHLSGAVGGTLLEGDISQAQTGGSPGNFAVSYPLEITVQNTSAAGWVALGYSHQFNNHFVLDGEVTAGYSNPRIKNANNFTIGESLISDSIDTQLKNDFALLFKPGYVFMKDSQLYVLGGARWGNIESSFAINSVGHPAAESESTYQIGWTVGLGLMHLITDRLTLGLEYAYTQYGDLDRLNTEVHFSSGGPTTVIGAAEQSLSTNTLAARLSYYF